MQVVRVYTGDDRESHLGELELPYEQIGNSGRTAMQSATITVRARLCMTWRQDRSQSPFIVSGPYPSSGPYLSSRPHCRAGPEPRADRWSTC